MRQKLSIEDLRCQNKKVLMRVDFNVPMDKEGVIQDDSRIVASLPSIKYVLSQGGSVILMSHLGRPKGKKDPAFSLAPCANHLSNLLGVPVIMAPDCIGEKVEKLAKNLQPGQVLLLENLRFYPAEENPDSDPTFAKQLANLGDLYVNDAFGTAHRAHSSTASITQYFPRKAAAGFLMQKEIQFLGSIVANPQRPFVAVIGGAKVSTKIGVLKSLLKKVDILLIGGGMAYTFLKAQGIPIGDSIHEDDSLQAAKEILLEAQKKKKPLILPRDVVIVKNLNDPSSARTIEITPSGIPTDYQGVDIGPKTIAEFDAELKKAKTVFWNGPVGVFEVPNFAKGTNSVAKTLASLKAITIVGGGDSLAALKNLELSDKITHLSTGGGASLEFLEFGNLPGIDALSDKNKKRVAKTE
jgi:phosphoglycerate kinase